MNLSFVSLVTWTVFAGFLWTLRLVLLPNGLVWWTDADLSELGHYPYFGFLFWNLLLAWVPYGISCWLVSRPASWWSPLSIIGLMVWLAFLPNAPYLLTDLIHLSPRGNVPYWVDVLLLVVFAVTGWLLGLASLRMIHLRFWVNYRPWTQWLLIGLVLIGSSYGVFLGRFLRLNSWELITRPWETFTLILQPLFQPADYGISLLLVPILSLLLLLSYTTFLTNKMSPPL